MGAAQADFPRSFRHIIGEPEAERRSELERTSQMLFKVGLSAWSREGGVGKVRRWFRLLHALQPTGVLNCPPPAWEGLRQNCSPENVHSSPTEKSGIFCSIEEEVKGGSTWGWDRDTARLIERQSQD